ncbi:hypothetical protein FDI24_gp128 [Acidovorax phage ACP17]|uniref:Uncharacterized protein n=1 Tax=Acidovorax phage ACP17 TaxID=2010329 RepID=A0A218M2X3_9CAUD|nr:hypothetical protein FDI24_gp128 [Acidovorax phage ACP17]ASD50408.1 hypothetical protein [Acidovorax phage ACP17]
MTDALHEETAPNVTGGVDNNSNGKSAALSTERRKELTDSIRAAAQAAAAKTAERVGLKKGAQ